MELSKLKFKMEEVELFNIADELNDGLNEFYKVTSKSSQIITSIIKKEEFTDINEYINSLDFDMDFMLWILYPKGTSKKYKGIVEVNRDDVRTKINDKVKTVSMVSLDSDWSAMRLRNKKYSK